MNYVTKKVLGRFESGNDISVEEADKLREAFRAFLMANGVCGTIEDGFNIYPTYPMKAGAVPTQRFVSFRQDYKTIKKAGSK